MAAEAPPEREPSNRGFWLVLVPIAVTGLVLVALVFAFRPYVRRNAASLVQSNLRRSVAAAREIRSAEGSFEAARPFRMRDALPDLLFIDPDEGSNDPGVVSVFASGDTWAGAARADTGRCFWIRTDGSGTTVLGTGTDCSGDEASTAAGTGWPDR